MWRQHRVEVLLVIAVVLFAGIYARASYIPSHHDLHVDSAEEKYDLDVGDPSPWFSAWSLGDGVTYAVIASDPDGTKLSVEVKEPAYRFARAGYGWLVAGVTLGNDHLIPYGMAVVGALSLLALLAIAVANRERLGPKVWLVLLNPAIYLGFAGDTSEPLAVLLLFVGLLAGSAWAMLALGVTRPTFLVAAWGRWRLLGAGVLSAAILGLYSLVRFGPEQFLPEGGRFGFPFKSFFDHPTVAGWLLGVVAFATLVVGFRARDWSWVAAAGLVLVLGDDVLRDPVNAWRAAGMLPVLWALGPSYSSRSMAEAPTTEAVAAT